MTFDGHSDPVTRDTPVDDRYRNTKNVRRFMTGQCGPSLRFDRPFMAWITNGEPKNMGQIVDEWLLLRTAGSE
ncbi:DUF6434 domain-containing protein [Pseudomonas amygdali]